MSTKCILVSLACDNEVMDYYVYAEVCRIVALAGDYDANRTLAVVHLL